MNPNHEAPPTGPVLSAPSMEDVIHGLRAALAQRDARIAELERQNKELVDNADLPEAVEELKRLRVEVSNLYLRDEALRLKAEAMDLLFGTPAHYALAKAAMTRAADSRAFHAAIDAAKKEPE